MRTLTTLVLILATSSALGDPKVDIRWRGQSFFIVESSRGTRIAFDPHAIEAYDRKEMSADVVLISHEHNDHNQVDAIRIRDKSRILHGLVPAKDNPRRFVWNEIDKTVDNVRIRSVGTFHDTVNGMERGLNSIFIVEMDGQRIVHLGDLGHLLTKKQIDDIGPVDVLMVPVGGVYTLNGSDAKAVVAQLKPRRVILPMHYGTSAFDELLGPEEFLDEIPPSRIQRLSSNRLTIDADRKPPAEPMIVLMGWK
jgi:L-ascorbate metabolism protein UlaG (beta-lactamase superfamily)